MRHDAFGVFGTALQEKTGVFQSNSVKMVPKTPNASHLTPPRARQALHGRGGARPRRRRPRSGPTEGGDPEWFSTLSVSHSLYGVIAWVIAEQTPPGQRGVRRTGQGCEPAPPAYGADEQA